MAEETKDAAAQPAQAPAAATEPVMTAQQMLTSVIFPDEINKGVLLQAAPELVKDEVLIVPRMAIVKFIAPKVLKEVDADREDPGNMHPVLWSEGQDRGARIYSKQFTETGKFAFSVASGGKTKNYFIKVI